MPLVSEIPEPIAKLDTLSKHLVKNMLPQLELIGQLKKIQARTEMYTLCNEKYALILKGEYKLMQGDKIVRLYGPHDIYYFTSSMSKQNVRFFCEYSSEALIFSAEELMPVLQGEFDMATLWDKWTRAQADLSTLIKSYYITAGMKPALEMRSYEPGDVIIQENDMSEEIYEMMDGTASVIANGIKVGQIEEGDIFGELSFLIESKRTASVVAEKACTVNLIKREDFMELIKHRPQLIYNIARSLAKRILHLNQQKSN